MKDPKLKFLLLITTLGYFVDAFDLVLFSVVRTKSIIDLGLVAPGDTKGLTEVALFLENSQAAGILLGGIMWGILGDKIGRLKVLYFSIACYSIANILNGLLISDIGNLKMVYSILRFISGFGLAGELGISITLVSEAMEKTKRGLGTMIIAFIGLLGCVAASALAQFTSIHWSTLFLIGGFLGIALLILRLQVKETELFLNQEKSKVTKGAFVSLFTNFSRLKRFLLCIGIGLPVYYIVGLPIKFSTNFGKAFGINETIYVPIAIMMCYLSMSIGDVVCNLLSQRLKSRKKALLAFNILNLISLLIFVYISPSNSFQYYYIFCPLLGFSVGCWALIVTIAAEQFGTNLRSTVATSVPNFIRSTFIPISIGFVIIEKQVGVITSATILGLACSIIAIICTLLLTETFGKDLNYVE